MFWHLLEQAVGNGAQVLALEKDRVLRAGVNPNGKGIHLRRHGRAVLASGIGSGALDV